jgi:autoinducer 2 (AI-2) kinase
VLYDHGLLTTRGGNLSVMLPGSSRIVITPSGLLKGSLGPSDMVVVGRDGRRVDPGPPDLKPSTETPVHTAVYRARPDARAIVHAHPPHATTVATLGLTIEPVTVELAAYSGVPTLPYLPPGSPSLARRIVGALADADLVLLAGHGAFAVGTSLDAAVGEMDGLERACQSYLLLRQQSGGRPLPPIPGDERGAG